VLIKGSIVGGSGLITGFLGLSNYGTLTVLGDIVGGADQNTGILSCLDAKKITVRGSILGGVQEAAGSGPAGMILGATIGSLTVGGDIVAGRTVGGGGAVYHGGIIATSIGTLAVGGSLLGTPDQTVFVLARGTAPDNTTNYNAFGKIIIKGSASYAYLAAGHTENAGDPVGVAENPDAGIGSIFVGGSLLDTSITAGIDDVNTTGASDADPASIGSLLQIPVIGSVTIKGSVLANAFSGVCGIGAVKVNKVTIGGATVFVSGNPTFHPNGDFAVDVFDLQ
jgi:hypothetical protein